MTCPLQHLSDLLLLQCPMLPQFQYLAWLLNRRGRARALALGLSFFWNALLLAVPRASSPLSGLCSNLTFSTRPWRNKGYSCNWHATCGDPGSCDYRVVTMDYGVVTRGVGFCGEWDFWAGPHTHMPGVDLSSLRLCCRTPTKRTRCSWSLSFWVDSGWVWPVEVLWVWVRSWDCGLQGGCSGCPLKVLFKTVTHQLLPTLPAPALPFLSRFHSICFLVYFVSYWFITLFIL